jgi:hypothetical protein
MGLGPFSAGALGVGPKCAGDFGRSQNRPLASLASGRLAEAVGMGMHTALGEVRSGALLAVGLSVVVGGNGGHVKHRAEPVQGLGTGSLLSWGLVQRHHGWTSDCRSPAGRLLSFIWISRKRRLTLAETQTLFHSMKVGEVAT